MSNKILSLTIAMIAAFVVSQSAQAFNDLGNNTGALIGNDLTDLGDDGVEGSYVGAGNTAGFDAVFFANKEAAFGGGENSFNIFDNQVGGGSAKSCCEDAPMIIGAMFNDFLPVGTDGIQLTSITMTSSNDSPNRDPGVWSIEGSNDTTDGFDGTWETVMAGPGAVWTERNQVLEFSTVAGEVFSTELYTAFRLNTQSVRGGSDFALGELELFGTFEAAPIPEPTSAALLGLGALAMVRRRRAAA